METNLSYKIPSNYSCTLCCYTTSYIKDYNKHLLTKKHKTVTMEIKENIKEIKKILICQNCDKEFITNSGLWKHKKKCSIIQCKIDLDDITKQHKLLEYLVTENSEFKQLMFDQNKQMIEQNKHMLELSKNTGNNNNNSTNNFNLQFFLNETCKNAMNIMDFVNHLHVSINDLEETGQIGFSEGISRIFINGLKQINIPDRPIHCSDLKRETIYIKDKNQWNKESDDKCLLTNAIKHVAHKNLKQISEWTKENPEYNDSESKQNDKYLKIVSNSMNGTTIEETNKNYNKIIKNSVKETIIDK